MGSMLILNLRVIGGFSLVHKKYFYVNYVHYDDDCKCNKIIGKQECAEQTKNVDFIDPEEVSEYAPGINYMISMIAPKRFKDGGINLGVLMDCLLGYLVHYLIDNIVKIMFYLFIELKPIVYNSTRNIEVSWKSFIANGK